MRDPKTRRLSNLRYESQPWVKAKRAAAAAARLKAKRQALGELRLLCRKCGGSFEPSPPSERYCSSDCRLAAARPKARLYYYANSGVDKTPRPCKKCQRVFSPPCGVGLRMFCSKKCGEAYGKAATANHRKRARHHGVPYEPVNRMAVFERDGWKCQVCGRATPRRWLGTLRPNAPELDHRVAMAAGGGHTYANVQCACRRCNGLKGAHRAVGQLPLLSDPKQFSLASGRRSGRLGASKEPTL